jgi:very-short-patch-repair endonuclease
LPSRNIVRGQKINPAKITRARELRQAMTPAERLLWEALRGNALAGLHFRRQQVIAGFIVDFYCHAASLAIELDGAAHRETHIYDEDRDRILTAQGVQVIRFSNDDLASGLGDVLARIAQIAGQRQRPNPRPLP